MRIDISDLSFAYKKKRVLEDVGVTLEPGLTALIGPNGAGKSTLIKCLAGILKPQGFIRFDGRAVSPSKKDYFAKISYMPQSSTTTAGLTVFETVLLGMLNSLSLRVGDEIKQKVRDILERLEIWELAEKRLSELSGGQYQMVSLAQSIIKEPDVLILDEPLNNLDIHRQFEILDLVSFETYRRNLITVIAMHDLNMAARYADSIILMDKGKIYKSGEPVSVLSRETILDIYHVNSEISVDDGGVPVINMLNIPGRDDSVKRGVFRSAVS